MQALDGGCELSSSHRGCVSCLPVCLTYTSRTPHVHLARQAKIKITTKITTSTQSGGLGCTAYVYAVIPQKKEKKKPPQATGSDGGGGGGGGGDGGGGGGGDGGKGGEASAAASTEQASARVQPSVPAGAGASSGLPLAATLPALCCHGSCCG